MYTWNLVPNLPDVLCSFGYKFQYTTISIGGIDMETYTADNIRNVVILGHGGCGKTTLVEAMAYSMGVTKRQD